MNGIAEEQELDDLAAVTRWCRERVGRRAGSRVSSGRRGKGPRDVVLDALVDEPHRGVGALAVLPNGHVVMGSNDGTLRVWDVKMGRILATLHGHQGGVKALAVLPDSRVVSGSSDKTLRVWDVETGRILATVYGDASFTSVACIDQHFIVAGDKAGNVWFIDLPELPPAAHGREAATTATHRPTWGRLASWARALLPK